MSNVIVKMEGISKAFPGVQALKDCVLNLYEGEVHALLGENGAGKSTLMKVLTGIYQADEGRMFFDGKKVKVHSIIDARRLGITMIHQEMNLLTNLTIAQNIYIGKEITGKSKMFLNEKAINQRAQLLLEKVNLNISASTPVSNLTIAQQQMVEIAKAISYQSKVIIMDEPTAALSPNEIDQLFTLIREMKANGISIIYISHRMDEIKQICDRATILRDGVYIATVDATKTSLEDIIAMMVGRKISYVRKTRDKSKISTKAIMQVKNLSWGTRVKNISFELHQGEILGFAGLIGAGRTEVARVIYGAEEPDSGDIFVNGEKVTIRSPYDAVRCGISYLSEDRKQFGLITEMNVEDNITIASLNRLCKKLDFVDRKRCLEVAKHYTELLKIKTPTVKSMVRSLSGGNQQKIVVGKWLLRNTNIVIFDEPTRGIDIGAKDEICNLLIELADMGKAVIMISSEMQEIMRVCDRIIVMHEGEITGELDANTARQEEILALASKM